MLSTLVVWIALSYHLSSSSTPPSPISKEGQPKREPEAIKTEPDGQGEEEEESGMLTPTLTDDLSDTSRTFPTLGRQMPLRYTGHGRRREGLEGEGIDGRVKREDEDAEGIGAASVLQPLNGEAADDEGDEDKDDEQGEAQSFRDSGIGTSIDDEGGRQARAQVQRRNRNRRSGLGGWDGE